MKTELKVVRAVCPHDCPDTCSLVTTVQDGVVINASVGAGGVAATPRRALQTQAALEGQTWSAALAQHAGQVMQAEFEPLSDLRASADYRRTLLKTLWQRCWLQSQGVPHLDLSDSHTLQTLSQLGGYEVAPRLPNA